MSDLVLLSNHRKPKTFARQYISAAKSLKFQSGNRTSVTLVDGRMGLGSCLGCGSPVCIEKDPQELNLFGALDSFPGDPSLDVCPTKAIQWDQKKSFAFINEAECIGCGLCVARCPYGAISMQNGLTASVATSDPDNLVVHKESESDHDSVLRSGRVADMASPAAANMVSKVSNLDDARVNLLIRNLLFQVGLKVSIRRRGDTNMRIDAVGFSKNDRPFVAEIETGAGVLESPRALLEDVAVLHSRYGFSKSNIDPLSIILTLPNVRSEYYQVIRDIYKVLGLQCRTLTVGILLALLWNFRAIKNFEKNTFAIGEQTIDLSISLDDFDQKSIEPYAGAYKPIK